MTDHISRTICRCGRLDYHAPHNWTRPFLSPLFPAHEYRCGGAPLTECSMVPINEDDALGDLT